LILLLIDLELLRRVISFDVRVGVYIYGSTCSAEPKEEDSLRMYVFYPMIWICGYCCWDWHLARRFIGRGHLGSGYWVV
jgi:hypothetical protein